MVAYHLYQFNSKILNINHFYFPFYSLKIISITTAMQKNFCLEKEKDILIYLSSFLKLNWYYNKSKLPFPSRITTDSPVVISITVEGSLPP